jgi:hypothetical protein
MAFDSLRENQPQVVVSCAHFKVSQAPGERHMARSWDECAALTAVVAPKGPSSMGRYAAKKLSISSWVTLLQKLLDYEGCSLCFRGAP